MYTPPTTTNVVTNFSSPPVYIPPQTDNIMADFAAAPGGGGETPEPTVSVAARKINLLVF
jgi:hypothetical protein